MTTASFTFPQDVPVLTDGGLTLRAHRAGDIPRIVEFANDARSRRFIPGLPSPYGMAQGQAFVDSRAALWAGDPVHPAWAIDVGGRFAGSLNLHPRGELVWEIGYAAAPDMRGRGVTTRAARLAVDYAFETLGARTLTWRCGAGNFASWRVAWANGFRWDGVWRDMHPVAGGANVDTWTGSLGRAEWSDAHARGRRPQRPWWEPAVLDGSRVRLRPLRDTDVPPVGPDAIAQRFNADAQPDPDAFPAWLLERRRRMAEGGGIYWCIADRTTDELLGHINLQRLHVDFTAGTGWMGYWLLPSARGQGHLAEALELLIPHAFAPLTDCSGASGLGLHRIYAGTDEGNRASQRTLRRAGFVECARERAALAHSDRAPSGALSFELLATDDCDEQRVTPRTTPVLETERLRLRPSRESDRPAAGMAPDPIAERFMANPLPTHETFDAALARRRRLEDEGTAINWCVADRATDECLGNIALFDIGQGTPTSAEVGYWLWPSCRGGGRAQEAVNAVVTWAFDQGGFTRLHAGTDADNVASQIALLRNGFREWGRDRAAYTNADGSVTDGAYYELLAADDREAQRLREPAKIDGLGIALRAMRMADVGRAHEAFVDPDYVRWINGDSALTIDRTRDWVSVERFVTEHDGLDYRWAITTPGDDRFLGCVAVQHVRLGQAATGEIGYWLHPDARGQGLATAAVRELASYAFRSSDEGGLGLSRLTLNIAAGNEASVRVADRCGFVPCGRDRSAEPLGDGRVVDLLRFERLAAG